MIADYECRAPRYQQLCRGRMVDHKTVLRCNVCHREAAPEPRRG